MCVAVIVQTKKRVPREQLKAMSDANPHGGGIAWYVDPEADDGVVCYRKGMTWEEIDEVQDRLPRPFFLHFRIATKGEKIPELTHPFPIGMQAFTEELAGIAEKGVLMHNGTWPDYFKFVPEGINPTLVSDTQVAAYQAAFKEKILEDVKWSNAVMDAKGIRYRGRWEKFEGNIFSNLYWQRELNKQEWEYDGFYRNSRTVTPIGARKKGSMPAAKSHQQGRTQDHGRTTTGQYQTQFNKSGKGVNTLQSNGKSIGQNRAEKRRLRQLQVLNAHVENDNQSAYEQARKSYLNPQPENERHDWANDDYIQDRNKRMSQVSTMSEGAWGGGEPLFTKDELKPTNQHADVLRITQPSQSTRRITQEMKTPVCCPKCQEPIEVIPCPCSMTAEELERYIATFGDIEDIDAFEEAMITLPDDDFLVEADTQEIPIEVATDNANETPAEPRTHTSHMLTSIPETSDGVPITYTSDGVQIRSFNPEGEQMALPFCDVSDVEDMNAYGAVFDGEGGPNTWKELQDAISRDGIKVRGE